MPGITRESEITSEERTHDIQPAQKSFPFLRLPAEIRNKIYRLVLLTRNVTTVKFKATDYLRTPDEVVNRVGSVQSGIQTDGTVRCKCWRTYTINYQVSILRVNRQIYRETWGIFNLENFWTVVQINKVGFGKQMQDRGFPVATIDKWRHIRFPVMKASVIFPSLQSKKETDTLVVATIHLDQLMRGLWTAKGASTMDVIISVQPRRTNHSPGEADLLRPLFKLRSIKRVMIAGVSNPAYVDELTRAIKTTDDLVRSYYELRASLKRVQQFIKTNQWAQAAAAAEVHVVFMNDCKTVYGSRWIGIEHGLNIHTAIARRRTSREFIIATATVVAQITFHIREYARAIHITSVALNLISQALVFQPTHLANPNVIAGPQHPLPPITISIAYQAEITSFLLLLRARAYIAMGRGRRAKSDIDKAGELMPNSVSLISVMRVWENTFGPSAPRYPAPSASSQ